MVMTRTAAAAAAGAHAALDDGDAPAQVPVLASTTTTTAAMTTRKRERTENDDREGSDRSDTAADEQVTTHASRLDTTSDAARTAEAFTDTVADIDALLDASAWAAVCAVEPDFVAQLAHFVVRAQGNDVTEPRYKVDPFQPAAFPRARGFFAHIAIIERDAAALQLLVRAYTALAATPHSETRGSRKLRLDDVLECAIALGRTELLVWLVQTLPTTTDWTWEVGLMRTALKQCSSTDDTNSDDPLVGVALLEWLVTHCPSASVALNAREVAHAVGLSRLPAVQWLDRHDATYSFSPKAMDAAAANGHLDVVQFLHEHRSDGCTVDALDNAAANGHLDVVEFLHAHRTEGCTAKAMDAAAANGHLAVVQFLDTHRSEGCTTKAIDAAAANGRLDVVQYLDAHRTEGCTTKAMDGAADRGHLAVLEFLQTNRREGFSPTRVVRWSNKTTALALVQFLHAHLPAAGWSEAAMDAAAEAGRLDTVQFLHNHRQEGCTTRAMDHAAERGHLDIVQFLHEHRREGCSVVAFVQAMKNGHDDVVKFLYMHRYKDNVPCSL